jgi:hypothetical protein
MFVSSLSIVDYALYDWELDSMAQLNFDTCPEQALEVLPITEESYFQKEKSIFRDPVLYFSGFVKF